MLFRYIFTALFAPTNAAFDKLPNGALDYILSDAKVLNSVLTYHVLPTAVSVENLHYGAVTLRGDKLTFSYSWWYWVWETYSWAQDIYVNGDKTQARIVATNTDVSNGVIHVIDAVLLPPEFILPSITDEQPEDENPEEEDVRPEEQTPDQDQGSLPFCPFYDTYWCYWFGYWPWPTNYGNEKHGGAQKEESRNGDYYQEEEDYLYYEDYYYYYDDDDN